MLNKTCLTLAGLPSRRGKNDQILEGLRALCSTQVQGQTFTDHQIAAACGVHPQAIVYIGRKAMHKFTLGLRASAPDVFDELLNGKLDEILSVKNRNPYSLTGKPFKRIAKPKARKERAGNVRGSSVELHDVYKLTRAVA